MTEPDVTETVESESADVETQVETDPDHAPETEVDPADADKSPEADETTDSDDSQAPDAELVTDLTEDEPLTPERIQKMRVSKDERAQLLREHEDHAKKTALLGDFGDEFEINALKPFAKLLGKSNATADEIDEAFTTFASANETVAKQLVDGITYAVVQTPELFEPVLKQVYGENATVSNVKKLLAFDKAGLIDHESGMSYLREDEDVIAQHDQEVKELKRQLAEAQNPTQPTAVTNAVQEFDTDFHKVGQPELEPFFKQLHWDGATTLTGLIIEALQNRLKKGQQYTETEKYLKETGRYRNGADVIPLANANLRAISNMTKAQGKALIREVQADIRKISENSRNAVQQQKKQEAEVAAQVTDKAKALDLPPESHEQRMARLDSKFKGRILQPAA